MSKSKTPVSRSLTLVVPTTIDKSIAPPPSKKETLEALAVRLLTRTRTELTAAEEALTKRIVAWQKAIKELPATEVPSTKDHPNPHVSADIPNFRVRSADWKGNPDWSYLDDYHAMKNHGLPNYKGRMVTPSEFKVDNLKRAVTTHYEAVVPPALVKEAYEISAERRRLDDEYKWLPQSTSRRGQELDAVQLTACRAKVKAMMAGTVTGTVRVADMLRNEETVAALDELLAKLEKVNSSTDKTAIAAAIGTETVTEV